MNHRLLDTVALTAAVTLATGAVMLGSALAPAPEGAAAEPAAMAALPVGLVSWAVHADEAATRRARAAEAPRPHALDDCRHEVERTLQQAASAGDRLALESGSGAVRVEGRAGVQQIRVVARLCASQREYLNAMEVTLERRGGTLDVRTRYPQERRRGWGDDYARIDLVVEVPAGMDAEIDDGSGALELTDVGSLRIHDGSGEIHVRGARDVRIDDSSGGIEVRDVRGGVIVRDGSGAVHVEGVDGDVDIEDGSGELTVRRIGGTVVLRDGSGSIEVRDVGGDLVVRSDGSGSLHWSAVAGRVDVPSKHRSDRERRSRS